MYHFMFIVVLVSLSVLTKVSGFIAYDCISSNLTTTQYSLNSKIDCMTRQYEPVNITQRIQVIQMRTSPTHPVISCKIKVTRLLVICGNIASYATIKPTSLATYIKEIPQATCHNIHETGEYQFNTRVLFSSIAMNGIR